MTVRQRDGERLGRPRRRDPAGPTCWRAAAEEGLSRAVKGGAAAYDRRRALPRLIGCDPAEFDRDGEALDRRVKIRLLRALRVERQRGRVGHWAYDLDRHLALLQALAGEAARRPGRGSMGGAAS